MRRSQAAVCLNADDVDSDDIVAVVAAAVEWDSGEIRYDNWCSEFVDFESVRRRLLPDDETAAKHHACSDENSLAREVSEAFDLSRRFHHSVDRLNIDPYHYWNSNLPFI